VEKNMFYQIEIFSQAIQRDEGLEEFSSYPLGSFLPFVVTAGMQIKSFQKADCRTAT
jgi:hypothetical protein